MSLKISSSLFEDELKSSFLNEDLEEYIENVKNKIKKLKMKAQHVYSNTKKVSWCLSP
jgi:hypothetical protein